MVRPASAPVRTPGAAGGSNEETRGFVHHSSTSVRMASLPSHLVPLCIDGSSNRYPFRFVVDLLHLHNSNTLRFFQAPIPVQKGSSASGSSGVADPSEKGAGTEGLSSVGAGQVSPSKTGGPSAGSHTRHNEQPLEVQQWLPYSGKRVVVPAEAYVFDEVKMVRGTILLVGATLELPDSTHEENHNLYILCVPNHKYYIRPATKAQEELLMSNLPRWLAVANSPFYNSDIAFLRLSIRLVGDATPTTAATRTKRQKKGRGGEHHQDPTQYLRGLYVTVRQGTSKARSSSGVNATGESESMVAGPDAARAEAVQSHSFLFDLRSEALPIAAGGSYPQQESPSSPQATMANPQHHSRTELVVVVPFDLASSRTISFGIDHALWGRLQPMLGQQAAHGLSLAALFGQHKCRASAATMLLTDAAGGETCRAVVSAWWSPAKYSELRLTFQGKNLFRQNFVFTDPFFRLRRLEEEDGAGAGQSGARNSSTGGSKSMGLGGTAAKNWEDVYRSEVYKGVAQPLFLPIALSLPPAYELQIGQNPTGQGQQCKGLLPMPLLNLYHLLVQKTFRQRGLHHEIALAASSGTSLRAKQLKQRMDRQPLDDFVVRPPSATKRFGTSSSRPSSARGSSTKCALRDAPRESKMALEAEPTVTAPPPRRTMRLPYRSPFFGPNVLPQVLVEESSELLQPVGLRADLLAPASHAYFHSDMLGPTIQLDDSLTMDVFDAEYDETEQTTKPHWMGSFGLNLQSIVRYPTLSNGEEQLEDPVGGTGGEGNAAGRRSVSPGLVSEASTGEEREIPTQRRVHVFDVYRSGGLDALTVTKTEKSLRLKPSEIKIFAPKDLQSGTRHSTHVRKGSRYSCGSSLNLVSCRLQQRYSFQDFLKNGWELSSTIVVDYTADAFKHHRNQVFANSWSAFHGLITAVNQLVCPFSSRGGSDLYGCGVILPEAQYSVFPVHTYPEIFNTHVDELTYHHSSASAWPGARGPSRAGTATDTAPSSAAPSPEPTFDARGSAAPAASSTAADTAARARQPFSVLRDWSGEMTLPMYEAKRNHSSRSTSGNSLQMPLFLCPIVRRLVLRCEAIQRARSAGLASVPRGEQPDLSIGKNLLHVVTVLIGSAKIVDLAEAVELLQQATNKPIVFLLVYVGGGKAPPVLATQPNVITVDFPTDGFFQLHHSFFALQQAFSAIPRVFLHYARLTLLDPFSDPGTSARPTTGAVLSPPPPAAAIAYATDDCPVLDQEQTNEPQQKREDTARGAVEASPTGKENQSEARRKERKVTLKDHEQQDQKETTRPGSPTRTDEWQQHRQQQEEEYYDKETRASKAAFQQSKAEFKNAYRLKGSTVAKRPSVVLRETPEGAFGSPGGTSHVAPAIYSSAHHRQQQPQAQAQEQEALGRGEGQRSVSPTSPSMHQTTLTVVDLYMSEEQILRKEMEDRKAFQSSSFGGQEANLYSSAINALMMQKHVEQLHERDGGPGSRHSDSSEEGDEEEEREGKKSETAADTLDILAGEKKGSRSHWAVAPKDRDEEDELLGATHDEQEQEQEEEGRGDHTIDNLLGPTGPAGVFRGKGSAYARKAPPKRTITTAGGASSLLGAATAAGVQGQVLRQHRTPLGPYEKAASLALRDTASAPAEAERPGSQKHGKGKEAPAGSGKDGKGPDAEVFTVPKKHIRYGPIAPTVLPPKERADYRYRQYTHNTFLEDGRRHRFKHIKNMATRRQDQYSLEQMGVPGHEKDAHAASVPEGVQSSADRRPSTARPVQQRRGSDSRKSAKVMYPSSSGAGDIQLGAMEEVDWLGTSDTTGGAVASNSNSTRYFEEKVRRLMRPTAEELQRIHERQQQEAESHPSKYLTPSGRLTREVEAKQKSDHHRLLEKAMLDMEKSEARRAFQLSSIQEQQQEQEDTFGMTEGIDE